MTKKVPFFKRYASLKPAALWLAEDGRHYSGTAIDKDGYRPDMARMREYLKPGRRLFICAWGAWAHGFPCVVATDSKQGTGKPWPGWESVEGPIRVQRYERGERLQVDVMVVVGGETMPRPCSLWSLTPYQLREGGAK